MNDFRNTGIKGIVEFCFLQMPSKCMLIALILIYDISSALFGPKIAIKVMLDPKMWKHLANTIIPIQLHFQKNTMTVN